MSNIVNKTFIYIIKNNQNKYKIGKSDNPYKRIKQLQTGNNKKLHLVAVVEAPKYLEKRLHSMAFFYKEIGEWYALTPEVLATLLDYVQERYTTTIFQGVE
jgi:exoribonuclease R